MSDALRRLKWCPETAKIDDRELSRLVKDGFAQAAPRHGGMAEFRISALGVYHLNGVKPEDAPQWAREAS